MGDLVTWLRAQLDEDEQVALEVLAERTTDDGPDNGVQIDESGRLLIGGADYAIRATVTAHILRHSPNRVLAEVEAKRRILDLYEWAAIRRSQQPDDRLHLGEQAVAEQALWHLAEPYADRPGYRDEWRPT